MADLHLRRQNMRIARELVTLGTAASEFETDSERRQEEVVHQCLAGPYPLGIGRRTSSGETDSGLSFILASMRAKQL